MAESSMARLCIRSLAWKLVYGMDKLKYVDR
jgi:hypothetical protein